MPNIVDKAREESIINKFEDICKRYGLYSTYVDMPAKNCINHRELYLLVGQNEGAVMNPDVSILNLLERQDKNPDLLYPDVRVFKITGAEPMNLTSKVINYCWYAEFIDKIFRDYMTPIPKDITTREAYEIGDIYQRSREPKYDDRLKADYKNALNTVMRFYKTYSPKNQTFKAKWMRYRYSSAYDEKHSKLYNFKTFINRDNQKVSIDALTHKSRSSNIAFLTIEDYQYKSLRKLLKDYPDVKYWADSKTTVVNHGEIKNKSMDNPWDGEKRKWKYRKIAVSQADTAVIAKLIHKTTYPDAGLETMENIINNDSSYGAIVVPASEFHSFHNLCKDSGIKYAIDEGFINTATFDTIPVLVHQDDVPALSSVVERMCYDLSNYHITTDTLEKTTVYSNDYMVSSLDEEIRRMDVNELKNLSRGDAFYHEYEDYELI